MKQDGETKPKYREKRQEEAALSAPAIHPSTVADMEAIAAANPDKDVAIALMMQLGTQDSVAQGFTDAYGDRLRHDYSRKKWYIWDGVRWKEDNKRVVFDLRGILLPGIRTLRVKRPRAPRNLLKLSKIWLQLGKE